MQNIKAKIKFSEIVLAFYFDMYQKKMKNIRTLFVL